MRVWLQYEDQQENCLSVMKLNFPAADIEVLLKTEVLKL